MTNEASCASIHSLLARILPLDHMSEESQRRMESSARLIKVKTGEVVIRQGERAEGAYYLVQGRVKLTIASNGGAEKVVEIVREQSCFGEALLFSDEPSPITAVVTKEAHLVQLRRDALLHCVEREPALALRILRSVGGCFNHLLHDIEACSLRTSLQRVAGFLLDEAKRETADDGRCSIQLPASKSVIASHLNITPETLSRSLSQLKGEGLIDVSRNVVQIHETAQLRSYASL